MEQHGEQPGGFDFRDRFDEALAAYRQGDYQQAERLFRELTELSPHLSEGFLNLGNVYYQQERLEEAEAQWKKAIDLDPMEAMAYLNLGNLYFRQSRLEEAVTYWEIFKKLQKSHANVALNLGIAYDQLQQPGKAMENYGAFLGLKPTAPEAAQIKSRFESARRMFENNIGVADGLLEKGNARKALEIYRQAMAAYPGTLKHYKTYASLLYQEGDYPEALAAYLAAFGKNPEDVAVLTNLGVLYERLNKPVDALWAYYSVLGPGKGDQGRIRQRADALLGQHQNKLADYFEEAKGLQRRGRFAEAQTMFERLSVLSDHLGGQAGEVKEWLEKAREAQDPKLKAARSFLSRGIDAQTNGRFDQALTFYQKYLQLMPEGPNSAQVRERVEEIKGMLGAVVNALLQKDG